MANLQFPKDQFTLETYVFQGTEIICRFCQDIPCGLPLTIKTPAWILL